MFVATATNVVVRERDRYNWKTQGYNNNLYSSYQVTTNINCEIN